MSAVKKMGRKRIEEGERRDRQIATYVSEREETAINILGHAPGYMGVSDVLRQGLALLIQTKHPELASHLRTDLRKPLTSL